LASNSWVGVPFLAFRVFLSDLGTIYAELHRLAGDNTKAERQARVNNRLREAVRGVGGAMPTDTQAVTSRAEWSNKNHHEELKDGVSPLIDSALSFRS
jgi:hypothetical protein